MIKVLIFLILATSATQGMAQSQSCVALIHGLARTSNSMKKMAGRLEQAGFAVVNIDYESRKFPIDKLSHEVIPDAIADCKKFNTKGINFVTHSLGGILVRHYLESHVVDELHRVVMLAPPNQGSEVVDNLRNVPGYGWFNGPAGNQLGTGEDSVPRALGDVGFELAVIAGTRTFNPVLSQFLPNPDDGKVSVLNARVNGMCWFLTVEESHPFIMKNDHVIQQVIEYLTNGRFSDVTAEQFNCPAVPSQ